MAMARSDANSRRRSRNPPLRVEKMTKKAARNAKTVSCWASILNI